MTTGHLSIWEQEEYLMRERTPQMVRHVTECSACRAEVERMEQGLSLFRNAAMEWSAGSLARRPRAFPATRLGGFSSRWAFAAVVPLVLVLLALLSFRRPTPTPLRPVAAMSDDALLDEVDEQLSVAVPSSMESLTHLVSAKSTQAAGAQTLGEQSPGDHANVQSN